MNDPAFAASPDSPGSTFHNGLRSRINAWFFDACGGYVDHVAREHKRRAFGGIAAATVLEIGAGSGANFRYLPRGARVLALEPNRAMHGRLLDNARAAGATLALVPAAAESIPLPDASVDTVIGSLVLCTVADPARALAEIRRVLRPGGSFRFVEHVAAPAGSVRLAAQRLVARPWAWLFEGCCTHRDTEGRLREAGFAELRVERLKLRHSLFYPVNTAIWGVAVNP